MAGWRTWRSCSWVITSMWCTALAALPHTHPTPIAPQVYPDVGVSAMLKNQWEDATFGFSSLNDRVPVEPTDDIIVLAAPDPQGADDAIRISQSKPGMGLGLEWDSEVGVCGACGARPAGRRGRHPHRAWGEHDQWGWGRCGVQR